MPSASVAVSEPVVGAAGIIVRDWYFASDPESGDLTEAPIYRLPHLPMNGEPELRVRGVLEQHPQLAKFGEERRYRSAPIVLASDLLIVTEPANSVGHLGHPDRKVVQLKGPARPGYKGFCDRHEEDLNEFAPFNSKRRAQASAPEGEDEPTTAEVEPIPLDDLPTAEAFQLEPDGQPSVKEVGLAPIEESQH